MAALPNRKVGDVFNKSPQFLSCYKVTPNCCRSNRYDWQKRKDIEGFLVVFMVVTHNESEVGLQPPGSEFYFRIDFK